MFHNSNLGSNSVPCDLDGYVPEANDGPWDFVIDHGSNRTHEDGILTEYGIWWMEEGFPQWQQEAIQATTKVETDLVQWQMS